MKTSASDSYNLVPHPLNGRMHLMLRQEAIANLLMWAGRSFSKNPKAVTLPSPYWNCMDASKAFLKPPMEDMNGLVTEERAKFINYITGTK